MEGSIMFLESFSNTILAVIQIILLAGVGYGLVKINKLDGSGLTTLSRLVVEVTLPVLIFSRLIKDFSFSVYPNWWIFPLLSILITAAGLAIGVLTGRGIKGEELKKQFLSLTAFQNSGYLPLALVAALLPKDKADTMFTYLFLFLLGFNLIIWSLGVHILSSRKESKFELGSLFSPPVIATLFSLVLVFFGLSKAVPEFILKPLKMAGDCTVPLAMIIVGGNLAEIHLRQVNKRRILLLLLSRMIVFPALGFWLITLWKLPELIGLLIVMQLAVPPATSLSVIMRHYKKEDLLISQGIFFGHMLSIITIPLFLSLYFAYFMVK